MNDIRSHNIRQLYPAMSRFCLGEVWRFDPASDERLADKRRRLLEAAERYDGGSQRLFGCNIKGCSGQIAGDPDRPEASEQTGGCTAAAYCLQTKFEQAVDPAKGTIDFALAKELMRICGVVVTQDGSLSSCPRLDCGLKAGVGTDLRPAIIGQCAVNRPV